MRQINLNECQEISGGVTPLAAIGGAAALGGFAANTFASSYPLLGPVLATIGSAAAGAAVTNQFYKGAEVLGGIAGGVLGFLGSQSTSTTGNHHAAVLGGASTAGTVAYFLSGGRVA